MFKFNNKKHQNDVNDVGLVFLLLTLNIFDTFFECFTDDFEQVNVSWDNSVQNLQNRLVHYNLVFNTFCTTIGLTSRSCSRKQIF